ncbi:hypothetical protein DL93DRAFT_1598359 [Clavulina sp. PMI_390]|nr:hypothetical protein DL93DRAFT_1598359 [Clavulina sp. PMI_390]
MGSLIHRSASLVSTLPSHFSSGTMMQRSTQATLRLHRPTHPSQPVPRQLRRKAVPCQFIRLSRGSRRWLHSALARLPCRFRVFVVRLDGGVFFLDSSVQRHGIGGYARMYMAPDGPSADEMQNITQAYILGPLGSITTELSIPPRAPRCQSFSNLNKSMTRVQEIVRMFIVNILAEELLR